MKILFSIFFPVVLFLFNSATDSDISHSSQAGPIDGVICGMVPPLCEGQCTSIGTDLTLKINGGTPPYKIGLTFNYNPTAPQPSTTYIIRDVNQTHIIRFCHDNTLTGPGGEELPGDTTIFKIPTPYLNAEILFRTIEDADLCTSTTFTTSTGINPAPIATIGGNYIDYDVNIPSHICDSLRLPPIMPAGNNASYYSEPFGAGVQVNPGDVLSFNDINLPNGDLFDTLYVFDPADACGSQAFYPFTINVGPFHVVPDDISQCDPYTLPDYPGPISSANAQYASTRTFDAGTLLAPTQEISSTQWVYLRDEIDYPTSGSCSFLDSFFVEILTAPNAGVNSSFVVCEGETTVVADLFDLLDGNPDAGGQWSGTLIPDLDFDNPVNVDLSHMTVDLQYVLVYTIEKPGCNFASAELVITAEAPPFAGDSTEIFLCSADGPQDLFALLNNPDLGGTWNQAAGQQAGFSDLSQADFSVLPDDLYTFTYTVPSTSNCSDQTAELKINLSSGPNAGLDNTALVCLGDSLELSQLLSPDAQGGGSFLAETFIPVTGDYWSSEGILIAQGQNSTEILLEYILGSNSPNCPSDTARFTITVIKEPFAGFPVQATIELCEGERIRLEELFDAEDFGGSFYALPDLLNPLPPNFTVLADPTEIAYIVPGTPSCPPDTSYVELTSVSPLIVNLSHAISTCREESNCLTVNLASDRNLIVTLGVLDQNGLLGTVIAEGTTYEICPYAGVDMSLPVDTFFTGNQATELSFALTEITDPLGICVPVASTFIGPTVTIYESYNDTIRGSVCEGMTTTINGKEYGSSTIVSELSEFGCDSTTHILIDTFPQEQGLITGTYCKGIPQDILNMTFVEDTDEIVIFPGQSYFGCDSIARVTLTFTEVTTGTLDTMICEDDFIVIEGEVFDKDRLNGEVDYQAGSAAGCDSSIVVNIGFLDPGIRIIDTLLCTGDFFELEGDIYNESNMDGITTLPIPAANDCDSLAQVMVTFQNNIREDRSYTICEGESLTIGGTTLDENNTSGVALLEGTVGCDTIANITAVVQYAQQVTISDTICENGFIEINGITYDTTNLSGSSSILSLTGCDSILYQVDLVVSNLAGDITVQDLGANSFQLSYTGISSEVDQEWSSTAALDCTENCNPTVTISDDTEVRLELIDRDGCIFSRSVTLEYTEIMEPDSTLLVYFPNMIDPESSQDNIFYIQTNEPMLITKLSIYDRWGNEIYNQEAFMSNDAGAGWDGTRSNSEIEQGAYIFYLEYEDPKIGTQLEVGSLTVIR